MKTMNCIVVDDDEMSRLVVKQCISRIDFLEVTAEFESAVEASKAIHDLKVDLIFLDVEMPEMSGLEFIQSLTNIPQVIIISSKSNYAAEAFDYNVTDYLVKPVEFGRLLKAAEKAHSIHQNIRMTVGNLGAGLPEFFIKVDSRYVRLDPKAIDFIEAQADYVTIHTDYGKRYTILSTMKAIESKLGGGEFARIHRSYIVRLGKIKEIEENLVAIGDGKKVLPISRSYRERLFQRLNLF